jgi:hypothetical protein
VKLRGRLIASPTLGKLPREFDRDHLVARAVYNPTEEMWAHRLRATFAPAIYPPQLVDKSLAETDGPQRRRLARRLRRLQKSLE